MAVRSSKSGPQVLSNQARQSTEKPKPAAQDTTLSQHREDDFTIKSNVQDLMKSINKSFNQSQRNNQIPQASSRFTSTQISVAAASQSQPPNYVRQNQLDPYMLLDYRAVGVELVFPEIELRNFKDWASYRTKGSKMPLRTHHPTSHHFSPRMNCQEKALLHQLPGPLEMKQFAYEHIHGRKTNPYIKKKIAVNTNKTIASAYLKPLADGFDK